MSSGMIPASVLTLLPASQLLALTPTATQRVPGPVRRERGFDVDWKSFKQGVSAMRMRRRGDGLSAISYRSDGELGELLRDWAKEILHVHPQP